MGMFLPIFVCLRFHIKCIAMASTTSKKSSRSSSDSSKALSLLATTTSIWAVVFKHTVITWGSLWRKKMLPMLYLGYLLSQQQKIMGWASSSVSTKIMKQTEGCDEPKEGEEDKISQHTILILKHADFVSEWWKLCFRGLEFLKFLGGWCPQTPLSSNPLC